MNWIRNLIILTVFSILPLQGFCDLFWVCYQDTIQSVINDIQRSGGRIIDIQTTRLNEYCTSYTIKYRN